MSYSTGRPINIFECKNGHQRITKDMDDGITYTTINCIEKSCKEPAISKGYQVDQNLKHSHIWYKPASLKGYNGDMLRYLKSGGLLLRKVMDFETINRETFSERLRKAFNPQPKKDGK